MASGRRAAARVEVAVEASAEVAEVAFAGAAVAEAATVAAEGP